MIRILDSNEVGKLLARKAARFAEAEAVLFDPSSTPFAKRGDKALLEYARKFDNFDREIAPRS